VSALSAGYGEGLTLGDGCTRRSRETATIGTKVVRSKKRAISLAVVFPMSNCRPGGAMMRAKIASASRIGAPPSGPGASKRTRPIA